MGKLVVLLVLVLVALGLYALSVRTTPIQPDSHPEEERYEKIEMAREEEWMNTLAHGKINHVQVWNPYGLSKKFKVVFDDGKMASGRLMRPFSFWNPAFREVPYRS